MEQAEILNPFGYLVASKVLDENRKPADWWIQYLEFNESVAENEFYVLFSDGLLVKKGKSKFKTSQYVKGEKYLEFKTFYNQAKLEKDSSIAWVLYGDNLPYYMVDSIYKNSTNPLLMENNFFAVQVGVVLDEIRDLLIAKNIKYGNSALEPLGVFSKLSAKEGLLVRIDDKLKRIKNGSLEKDDEDVVNDLIGYLVLLKIQADQD